MYPDAQCTRGPLCCGAHPRVRRFQTILKPWLVNSPSSSNAQGAAELLWRTLVYPAVKYYQAQGSAQGAEFQDCLTETAIWYASVAEAIRARAVPDGAHAAASTAGTSSDSAPYNHAQAQGGRRMVALCLVWLGDLCRYAGASKLTAHMPGPIVDAARQHEAVAEVAPDAVPGIAAKAYAAASILCPSQGRGHNQLAVLSQKQNDELSAVYSFVRAMACTEPFQPARDNLLSVLDRNRSQGAAADAAAKIARLDSVGLKMLAASPGKAVPKDTMYTRTMLMQWISHRWVRMVGICSARAGLEALPQLASNCQRDLGRVLRANVLNAQGSGYLLQLLVLGIHMCTEAAAASAELEAAAAGSAAATYVPSGDEVARAAALAQYAQLPVLQLIRALCTVLGARLKSVKSAGRVSSPRAANAMDAAWAMLQIALPALGVAADWLYQCPAVLKGATLPLREAGQVDPATPDPEAEAGLHAAAARYEALQSMCQFVSKAAAVMPVLAVAARAGRPEQAAFERKRWRPPASAPASPLEAGGVALTEELSTRGFTPVGQLYAQRAMPGSLHEQEIHLPGWPHAAATGSSGTPAANALDSAWRRVHKVYRCMAQLATMPAVAVRAGRRAGQFTVSSQGAPEESGSADSDATVDACGDDDSDADVPEHAAGPAPAASALAAASGRRAPGPVPAPAAAAAAAAKPDATPATAAEAAAALITGECVAPRAGGAALRAAQRKATKVAKTAQREAQRHKARSRGKGRPARTPHHDRVQIVMPPMHPAWLGPSGPNPIPSAHPLPAMPSAMPQIPPYAHMLPEPMEFPAMPSYGYGYSYGYGAGTALEAAGPAAASAGWPGAAMYSMPSFSTGFHETSAMPSLPAHGLPAPASSAAAPALQSHYEPPGTLSQMDAGASHATLSAMDTEPELSLEYVGIPLFNDTLSASFPSLDVGSTGPTLGIESAFVMEEAGALPRMPGTHH